MYDVISCKHCFHLLICNELSCIDQGDQLLIITSTVNIINLIINWYNSEANQFKCFFLHGYFLQWITKVLMFIM